MGNNNTFAIITDCKHSIVYYRRHIGVVDTVGMLCRAEKADAIGS